MPAPAHLRVSFGGAMGGTEVWSINFAVDGRLEQFSDPEQGAEDLQDLSIAYHEVFRNQWVISLDDLVGNTVTFQSTRVSQILGTGLTFAIGETESVPAVPGAGSLAHPPQIAAVVSLRTARVGASGRGRVYFPATGMALHADGVHIAAAEVTTLITGFKLVFDAINDVIATPAFVGDMNVAVASNAGLGAINQVTRIQVGNVFDTQRRRRDDIAEAYETRDLDATSAVLARRESTRRGRGQQDH